MEATHQVHFDHSPSQVFQLTPATVGANKVPMFSSTPSSFMRFISPLQGVNDHQDQRIRHQFQFEVHLALL